MKGTPGWECARYQTILMHTASLSGTDEMKQIKNALISGGGGNIEKKKKKKQMTFSSILDMNQTAVQLESSS